ncbi:unnamed protein product [Pleuronectes platessa]|uniref:Uncharacterized protein n=1 Tax=Pleuronectes platessa TaxID=8262 RepID=A0A9N7YL55_PLEPL|nr:unnamed protein product [Pleuronectes platessa]
MSPATLNSLSQAAEALPFVHTAPRYYRLDGLVRSSDRPRWSRASVSPEAEVVLEGKEMFEIVDPHRQVVLINPDGERPVPGCPMVPCLLCTKTPHWEAPVSK